ncbi:hypothetical protein EXN66_Car012827 [Channa argus]|uniref:Uncharacterized protein n=1 Tax=Channa argus TaxID=215402 RepID=A0A6G1Q3R2_CHAAH|nr:hypothetical protein EXN66_Car012827 [Channa argus]
MKMKQMHFDGKVQFVCLFTICFSGTCLPLITSLMAFTSRTWKHVGFPETN